MAEPKESLEVSTANIRRDDVSRHNNDIDSTTSGYCLMASWCLAMYAVAKAIRDLLDLPPHVLLYENDGDGNESSCKDSNGELIDLMRVFYYHRVKKRQKHEEGSPTLSQGAPTPILGSSPQ